MTIYPLALFVHVLGALTLFVALGLEWAALRHLRGATTLAQARASAAFVAPLRWLYPPAALAILLTGLYMTLDVWGWGAGWTGTGLLALVVLAACQ